MDPNKNKINPPGLNNTLPNGSPQLRMPESEGGCFLALADMVAEFSSSPDRRTERFDMGVISPSEETESRHFDEHDFRSHRSQNFPLAHQPLSMRSRAKRKMFKSNSRNTDTDVVGGLSSVELDITPSPETMIAVDVDPQTVDIAEEEHETESSPLLFQSSFPRAEIISASLKSNQHQQAVVSHPESSPRRVQFEFGGIPLTYHDDNLGRLNSRSGLQSPEGTSWRLLGESEVDSSNNIPPTDVDEVDNHHLASHRFHHNKGFRRHKFFISDDNSAPEVHRIKSCKYNHQPHEVFVEMDILTAETPTEAKEWKEAARWIKYEEDVEEGTGRWGKPHVASLSFHGLINLKRLLETGAILLDMEEKELAGIAYRVVEQMESDDLVVMEEKVIVLRNLLLKHKHIHAGNHVWKFNLRRNTASLANLQTVFEDKGRNKLATAVSIDHGVLRRGNSTTAKLNERFCENNLLSGNSTNITVDQHGDNHWRHSSHLDLTKLPQEGMSEEDYRWLVGHENILRRIPHGSELALVLIGVDDTLKKQAMAFVRLADSVYMPNVTEVPIPVRFVFVLMGPSSEELDYKEIGRSISTLMSNRQFHSVAYKAQDRKHLLRGIHDFLDSSIVIPPGDWDWDNDCIPFQELREKSKAIQRRKQRKSFRAGDVGDGKYSRSPEKRFTEFNPFKRTKRFFGGLRNDIRRRYPLYLSDIKDGLNSQCLATIIFLYFAAVSGAIAFGDLMGEKTNQYIGISETLIGTSIGGIVMALFAGQPLLIVGSTGTTLVFDESLYKFCQSMDMTGGQFLSIRTWIGAWMIVIGLTVVAFEGSVVVRFFSRFTQEVYATLISFVFIYESFNSLIKIFNEHPVMRSYESCGNETANSSFNGTSETFETSRPNVALLSLILMLGTFYIANSFKQFRNTSFFNTAVRKTIANFAVLIAIIFMGFLDWLMKDTQTDKLKLPDLSDGLQPSNPENRSWFINPFEMLPIFWIFASAIPALLLFMLVFMDTCISELIIGKKELKLKKGSGFHLDVLLMCGVNFVMGYLGTCWISAASVRCVTHTVALTVFSSNNPPGEKPVIVGIKEQRVTAVFVSLLIGLSVLMADVLGFIPSAVLFGVFLFMGVSSMAGVQLLERVSLLFKQSENHPQVPYVRRVRTWKMHIFTAIQLVCLVFLWGIKGSPAALSLPLLIFLLVPFRRFILPFWFKPLELAALDAEGLEINESQEKLESSQEIPYKCEFGEIRGKFNSGEMCRNGSRKFQDFRSI